MKNVYNNHPRFSYQKMKSARLKVAKLPNFPIYRSCEVWVDCCCSTFARNRSQTQKLKSKQIYSNFEEC